MVARATSTPGRSSATLRAGRRAARLGLAAALVQLRHRTRLELSERRHRASQWSLHPTAVRPAPCRRRSPADDQLRRRRAMVCQDSISRSASTSASTRSSPAARSGRPGSPRARAVDYWRRRVRQVGHATLSRPRQERWSRRSFSFCSSKWPCAPRMPAGIVRRLRAAAVRRGRRLRADSAMARQPAHPAAGRCAHLEEPAERAARLCGHLHARCGTDSDRMALLRRFAPWLPAEFRRIRSGVSAQRGRFPQRGDVAPAKRPGVLRIACIGDSWTFGMNVNQDQTYPARLEALLSRKSRVAPSRS